MADARMANVERRREALRRSMVSTQSNIRETERTIFSLEREVISLKTTAKETFNLASSQWRTKSENVSVLEGNLAHKERQQQDKIHKSLRAEATKKRAFEQKRLKDKTVTLKSVKTGPQTNPFRTKAAHDTIKKQSADIRKLTTKLRDAQVALDSTPQPIERNRHVIQAEGKNRVIRLQEGRVHRLQDEFDQIRNKIKALPNEETYRDEDALIRSMRFRMSNSRPGELTGDNAELVEKVLLGRDVPSFFSSFASLIHDADLRARGHQQSRSRWALSFSFNMGSKNSHYHRALTMEYVKGLLTKLQGESSHEVLPNALNVTNVVGEDVSDSDPLYIYMFENFNALGKSIDLTGAIKLTLIVNSGINQRREGDYMPFFNTSDYNLNILQIFKEETSVATEHCLLHSMGTMALKNGFILQQDPIPYHLIINGMVRTRDLSKVCHHNRCDILMFSINPNKDMVDSIRYPNQKEVTYETTLSICIHLDHYMPYFQSKSEENKGFYTTKYDFINDHKNTLRVVDHLFKNDMLRPMTYQQVCKFFGQSKVGSRDPLNDYILPPQDPDRKITSLMQSLKTHGAREHAKTTFENLNTQEKKGVPADFYLPIQGSGSYIFMNAIERVKQGNQTRAEQELVNLYEVLREIMYRTDPTLYQTNNIAVDKKYSSLDSECFVDFETVTKHEVDDEYAALRVKYDNKKLPEDVRVTMRKTLKEMEKQRSHIPYQASFIKFHQGVLLVETVKTGKEIMELVATHGTFSDYSPVKERQKMQKFLTKEETKAKMKPCYLEKLFKSNMHNPTKIYSMNNIKFNEHARIKDTPLGPKIYSQVPTIIPISFRKKDKMTIMMHNAQYDSRFIMKHLARVKMLGNMSSSRGFSGYYDYRSVKIIDTCQTIGGRLADMPKTVGKKDLVKKDVIPYDMFTTKNLEIMENRHFTLKEVLEYLPEKDRPLFMGQILRPGETLGDTDRDIDLFRISNEYCVKDTSIMMMGHFLFHDMLTKSFGGYYRDKFTISSAAKEVFTSHGVFKDICEVTGGTNAFIRDTCFGGRTFSHRQKRVWFKGSGKVKLCDLDARSLYPSAIYLMLKKYGGFPTGGGRELTESQCNNEYLQDKNFYFIDITVHRYQRETDFPVLCRKGDLETKGDGNGSIEYIYKVPDEGIRVRLSSISFRDLLLYHELNDDDYVIHNGVIFEGQVTQDFSILIDYITKLRSYMKQAGQPVQTVLKLVSNSTYGKCMQMRFDKTFDVFKYKTPDNLYNELGKRLEVLSGYNTVEDDEDNKFCVREEMSTMQHSNMVHIASLILAESKCIMNLVFALIGLMGGKIVYSDTDSIFIDRSLLVDKVSKRPLLPDEYNDSEVLINPSKVYDFETKKYVKHGDEVFLIADLGMSTLYEILTGEPFIGPELGQFHDDLDLGDEDAYVSEMIVTGPKMRACKCWFRPAGKGEEEEITVIKSKGIPTAAFEYTAKHLGTTTWELFERMYNGDTILIDLLRGGEGISFEYTDDGNVFSRTLFQRSVKATYPMPTESEEL